MNAASVVVNCALPFDDRLTEVKGLIVQRVTEGQRNVSNRIITVIADVHCTRHDWICYLGYCVMARCTCGRRRRCRFGVPHVPSSTSVVVTVVAPL